MDLLTDFFAQTQAPAPGGGGGQILFMVLIFAAMWFLLIAPQRKKQKKHQQMISQLESGTDVITSGGIYGTITNVKEDRFVLKIADNTKIEIAKSSVATVLSKDSDA